MFPQRMPHCPVIIYTYVCCKTLIIIIIIAGDITSRTTKPRSSTNVNQVDPETEQTDDVKTKPKTQAEISGTDFIRRNIEVELPSVLYM